MFVRLKSSNSKGNAGRSASDLISVDAKYPWSNLFSKKYIVTIREFHL